MAEVTDDTKIVEMLGGEAGHAGNYLSRVYDQATGAYFTPVPANAAVIEDIEKLHARGAIGTGTSIAILDTGLMRQHPLIKKSLIEEVDFTNSSPEDGNGHGTMVALLALYASPAASLYSAKILDDAGEGKEQWMIAGIQWAIAKKATVINISAGIHNRKWGRDCQGNCRVCQAAKEATKQGIVVVAAAGNEAGTTYCPATVGVYGGDVIAVAAVDMETLKPASYSGKGDIAAPSGLYELRPVDNSE
jgi:subtilisin family serine protease